ncbi:TrbI/VirB10 family protein [Rhizobium beringeri]
MIGGVTQYIAPARSETGPQHHNRQYGRNRDQHPQDTGSTSQDRAREIGAETIAAGIQQLATEAFQDTRNIKPTIHIAQGSDITVFVTRDLDFSDSIPDPVREARRAPAQKEGRQMNARPSISAEQHFLSEALESIKTFLDDPGVVEISCQRSMRFGWNGIGQLSMVRQEVDGP